MKVYKVRVVVDNARFLSVNDFSCLPDFDGQLILNELPVFEVSGSGEINDFLYVNSAIFACSARARLVLMHVLVGAVQFVELKTDDADNQWFLFNVIDVVNALDGDASEIKRFSGSNKIKSVAAYKFHDELLSERIIFKVPEAAVQEILCTDIFINLVSANYLTGLKFVCLL